MAEIINGVPIGDLPGIESVPDDSMLVVEFLGKAYHMPGAVLRQMIQDVLDSMGDSVDDVTEARLTAAIETVLSSGKYNGVSPSVEVLDEEDGTSVIHIIDAFGDKRYPVEVKGARNAVQYVEQELTDEQKAQARKNIGVGDGAGTADAVQYVPQTLTAEQQTQARNNIGISTHVSDLGVIVNPNYDLTSQHVMMDWGYVFEDGTKIDSRFEFDVPYSAYELARRNGYTKDELTFYKEMSSNLGNPKADSLQIDSDTGTLMLLSAGEPIGEAVTLPGGNADDSKIFIADLNTSTYEDIKAADDAGKICYALWGGYTACMLTTLSPESAIFTTLLDPNLGLYVKFTKGTVGVSDFGLTESHSVLYEPQSLTDAQKAQARENIGALSADDIDVDSIGSNVFVGKYDTVTFTEIKTAHDAGRVCFLDFKGIPFLLLGVDDTEALFVREMNENQDYEVTITANGEKSFKILDKNISNVYVAGLFSAKYAEVKAAYDAGKACFVTYGALLCPLTVLDEEKAEFVGMLTPNMGIKGIVPAEGTIDWTYVRSNAVQTVEQSLTDAQKAQARKNIGAEASGTAESFASESAKLQSPNDLVHNGNEFTFIPDSFTGEAYINYRTASGHSNGKISNYHFCDGSGKETTVMANYFKGKFQGPGARLEYNGKEVAMLSDLSGVGDNVFIADPKTTTFEEIVAAVEAGKVCYSFVGNLESPAILTTIYDNVAYFACMQDPHSGYELQFTAGEAGASYDFIDSNSVQYVAQSLNDTEKAQARSNIGAAAAADLSNYVTAGTAQTITGVKTFNAPANVAGTEQHTVKFKTSNGGAIIFGKEAANSGTMLRFDQVDGTTRLRFRGSDSAGAIVWEQPEQGAQLYVDLGKQGVDKHRINFPSSGGTLALTSQIPSLSGYLPLSGGLMTGSLKFQAASLPGKSLQYICGVDAFASGGEMGWQSKADFLSGYLTTTGTAAKATADANGNNIASTYASKTVANTFDGEQRMVNSTHCPTMNDIANGVGCSLKNARACDNQLIVAEIFAPTTTVTDSKINMSAVAGEIGFYHGGSGSGGQFSGKTQLARITSAGIYEGSTLLSNKYLAKSGGTMTGALNLKNSTWNLAGDDAYFGDNDTAGSFAIKGANGTTNLKMVTYNGTTSGTLSWNGSNFAFSNALNFPGGTLTGNLTVGSAKIQTNGYVIGTWLQTTAGNASSSAMSKVCVQSPDGWIYTRTLDQLRNDMNAASKDEVVTAANGALKVTLSGNDTDGYSVDKTYAEIQTAWNAGRYVYVTNGAVVYNPSLVNVNLGFIFTYTRATGDGVEVWSVLVNNLGTKPTVVKKTITA